MKYKKDLQTVLNSYEKEVQRLRRISPEWKPISFREYALGYNKKLKSVGIS